MQRTYTAEPGGLLELSRDLTWGIQELAVARGLAA